MKKERRKKNDELRRRYDAIKNLMSTFAMSTVAVVAAVTLIPASPKAEIVKAVSLSEEVVYQVNVTDEEDALDLSTLYVVLENQLEYYEKSISLGENSGFFANLENNTEYRLSVYGNKGFGQERLDTILLTTRQKVGGTILAVTPEDHETIVQFSIYDPDQKYSSISIFYGSDIGHGEEIVYSSVPITTNRGEITIPLMISHNEAHIYLEATTVDGIEVLDEIWVSPPFQLHSFVHVSHINNNQIVFNVYNDESLENIYYLMKTYKEERLIQEDMVVLEQGSHEGYRFTVGDLNSLTTYYFECVAVFTNPQTLRTEEQIIFQEEHTTLDNYEYNYSKSEMENEYQISISLYDTNEYYQFVQYEVYDTSGEVIVFIETMDVFFELVDNTKIASFSVEKPNGSNYIINITLRNETDFNIIHIIDEIEND